MKAIYLILILTGALSPLALAGPLPIIAGPAEVAVHGVSQNQVDELIRSRTNVVRGITNFTETSKFTTTNFTLNASSLMALLENSFRTNFPPGSQLLLNYAGYPAYTLVVSDSTGTNLGFDPRPVLSSSYLGPESIVSSGVETSVATNDPASTEGGRKTESRTTALAFTYDDSAMTNPAPLDGTHTKFTWVALVQSKDSLNLANNFYNQNVSMEITGAGALRISTNSGTVSSGNSVFTGSIRAKVSGFGN